jgi:hypothetical protein
MPELHHIIASILRDISQARASSDIYSRNLSKYYEQDPLLRRFPTPRTDIDEIEIDLKFAISGIEINPSQEENREAMAATIFVKYSEYITEAFFDAILNSLDRLLKEKKIDNEKIDPQTLKKIRGFEHRIYLRQDILLYFQLQKDRLLAKIRDGGAHQDIKENILHRVFEKIDEGELSESQLRMAKSLLFQDSKLSTTDLKLLEKHVFKDALDKKLKEILQEMQEPLSYVWERKGDEKIEGDKKISVEVTADKLRETPESVISLIKIKARVQNYIWTKVEHEGRQWRSLNPE